MDNKVKGIQTAIRSIKKIEIFPTLKANSMKYVNLSESHKKRKDNPSNKKLSFEFTI